MLDPTISHRVIERILGGMGVVYKRASRQDRLHDCYRYTPAFSVSSVALKVSEKGFLDCF
jgi:hypothetical protein